MANPPERTETPRQALRAALSDQPKTALALSGEAGVSEKEVARLLEHVDVIIHPAECLACEFVFDSRRRTKKPGRCPKCRSERISPPAFSVRGDREGESD